MLIVYAKWNGTNRFHAFDLENGVPVTNIIHASCYGDREIERAKLILQRLCDGNKNIDFKIQLRRDSDRKVMWKSA